MTKEEFEILQTEERMEDNYEVKLTSNGIFLLPLH